MSLSVVVALTLSPALCATILRPTNHGTRRCVWGLFNRGHARTQQGYVRATGVLVRRRLPALVVYAVVCGLLALLFGRMPKGFLPDEDQGQLNVQTLLPPGATQEQFEAAANAAKAGCPVSRALASVPITMTAKLEA